MRRVVESVAAAAVLIVGVGWVAGGVLDDYVPLARAAGWWWMVVALVVVPGVVAGLMLAFGGRDGGVDPFDDSW